MLRSPEVFLHSKGGAGAMKKENELLHEGTEARD
jgi:hypothetical protein